MEQFKYNSSHPCHLTLKVEDEHRDFSLFKGETYDLPETNSVIQRMVAQGLLEPVSTDPNTDSVNTLNTQSKNKKSNGS